MIVVWYNPFLLINEVIMLTYWEILAAIISNHLEYMHKINKNEKPNYQKITHKLYCVEITFSKHIRNFTHK